MFKPLSLFIGTRYTNFKRRDHFITFISIISIIGIAIGVMVLITVLSVMNGFTKEIRTKILSISPHILLSAQNGPLKDWETLNQQLKNHKGIEAIGPYIDGQGMLTTNHQVHGCLMKGIDPSSIEAVFPLSSTLIEGRIEDLQPGKYGVILGSYLAKALGVKLGDTVTLMIPDITVSMAGASPRMKRLTVVGIFNVGYIYDSGYAFLNIQDAGKIYKTHGGVTGMQFKLSDPFAAPRIAHELNEETNSLYQVIDWTVLNSHYFAAIKMQKTMLFFTLLMILAIAAFNLISTLVMIVIEKRGDIGVLRSLGASSYKIMSIFMSQGLIIGILGTLIGVLAGVILALNVTDLVAAIEQTFRVKLFATDNFFLSFLPSDLHYKDVILIILCALILSLLATLHPAWRAARTQPAKALRQDS